MNLVFHSRDSCSDFEKELVEHGYKKWVSDSHIFNFDYCYQRRFDDKLGKKYFIDFQFYDYMKYYHDHGISVKASTTFNNDNEEPGKLDKTVWLDFDFDSIEQAEAFVETMWKASNSQHYELWSEC